MKRALTIAAALAHRPALVFLDEPTTGLYMMHARHVRRMITELKEEGVTVFLTTHYLEEAERLCDQIALIVEGHITFGNVHLPARLPFQSRRMRREYPLKGRL
jgi:ABC-2 type transport system ATP-binding protein